MNKKIKINSDNINNTEILEHLIDVMCSFEEDIDILVGSYVLDAKSILVWIVMDLSKDIFLHILTDDEQTYKKFYDAINLVVGVEYECEN